MATQTQPRTQPVVPIIVNQILSCRQSQFHVGGRPAQITSLVGVISDVTVDSTEIGCFIEDYSGKVKGVLSCESESEVVTKLLTLREHKYAKLFGSVRINSGEKVFMIMKSFLVDDLNEITSHLLQAACCKLEAEAELNEQISTANTSGAALADALVTNDDNMDQGKSKLNEFHRLVYNIIKSEDSDYGMHRRGVLRQFPSYQGHDVNQSLDFLINEGFIYQTIDRDHLKVAMQIPD